MNEITNPFQEHVGKLYAAGRPYYHPAIMNRIRAQLELDAKVPLAVDVGCGTGLSSVALAEIGNRITAVDPSAEMLEEATPHPNVTYQQAAAEQLPLADSSADLMTLASVFHWLDRERFLKEAHRTLKDNGHLIIYDHLFTGQMAGNPDFKEWHTEYVRAFPSPPRKREPFGPDQATLAGFKWLTTEQFENPIELTPAAFTAYLLSQSNAAADPERVQALLKEEISTVFKGQPIRTFMFRAIIAYLQKSE